MLELYRSGDVSGELMVKLQPHRSSFQDSARLSEEGGVGVGGVGGVGGGVDPQNLGAQKVGLVVCCSWQLGSLQDSPKEGIVKKDTPALALIASKIQVFLSLSGCALNAATEDEVAVIGKDGLQCAVLNWQASQSKLLIWCHLGFQYGCCFFRLGAACKRGRPGLEALLGELCDFSDA